MGATIVAAHFPLTSSNSSRSCAASPAALMCSYLTSARCIRARSLHQSVHQIGCTLGFCLEPNLLVPNCAFWDSGSYAHIHQVWEVGSRIQTPRTPIDRTVLVNHAARRSWTSSCPICSDLCDRVVPLIRFNTGTREAVQRRNLTGAPRS